MSTKQPGDTDVFFLKREFNDWFDKDLSIYHCVFEREAFSDALFERHNMLMPDRLLKSVLKRRAEYFAGRYCAIRALQQVGVETVFIDTGQNREPIWPTPFIGSISHSSNHAVALIEHRSQYLGIGIDIEDEVSAKTMSNVESQIVNEQEVSIISQDIHQKAILFTLAFSVKEAFFKAAYSTVGRYFGFDAVSIVDINFDKGTVSFKLNETLDDKLRQGMLVQGLFKILPNKQVVTCVILDH